MTTTVTGRQAEAVAVEFLKRRGYKIHQRNWRTRYCEVDIIAERNKTIHFVEVKYRNESAQGSGIDYITAHKIHQMQFAADLWVHEKGWTGDYLLSAAEVSGPEFVVTNFVESCI